jgi:rare lipoprotein A
MILTRTLSAAALCLVLTPALAKPATHPAKSEKTHAVKEPQPVIRMVASVYWEGSRVATGSKFDPNGMTVAHKSLPFGTRLLVSYGRNNAEVVVNDRGPYVYGREIDLTRGVAKVLHFSGVGNVRVGCWPPLPRPRPDAPIELSGN